MRCNKGQPVGATEDGLLSNIHYQHCTVDGGHQDGLEVQEDSNGAARFVLYCFSRRTRVGFKGNTYCILFTVTCFIILACVFNKKE